MLTPFAGAPPHIVKQVTSAAFWDRCLPAVLDWAVSNGICFTAAHLQAFLLLHRPWDREDGGIPLEYIVRALLETSVPLVVPRGARRRGEMLALGFRSGSDRAFQHMRMAVYGPHHEAIEDFLEAYAGRLSFPEVDGGLSIIEELGGLSLS